MGAAKNLKIDPPAHVSPLNALMQMAEPEVHDSGDAAEVVLYAAELQDMVALAKRNCARICDFVAQRMTEIQPAMDALEAWARDAMVRTERRHIDVDGIRLQLRKQKDGTDELYINWAPYDKPIDFLTEMQALVGIEDARQGRV